jgi:hypothetical protein
MHVDHIVKQVLVHIRWPLPSVTAVIIDSPFRGLPGQGGRKPLFVPLPVGLTFNAAIYFNLTRTFFLKERATNLTHTSTTQTKLFRTSDARRKNATVANVFDSSS